VQVYERIEITASRHTLTRTDDGTALWPLKYRLDESPDIGKSSCITFIRPRLPVGALQSCRHVKEEAAPILHEKMNVMQTYPLRFILEISSSYALSSIPSPLSACVYLHNDQDRDSSWADPGPKSKIFIDRCVRLLRHLNFSASTAHIEITILADSGEAHDSLLYRLYKLSASRDFTISITYQDSPGNRVPDVRVGTYNKLVTLKDIGMRMQWHWHNSSHSTPPVRITGLREYAFSRHVEMLEEY
jgi:hypothetical protein